MRFALTEDLEDLARTTAEFLSEVCPPSLVRAQWDAAPGATPVGAGQALRGVADLGLLGALVPEGDGGLGLDEIGLVALLEQAGRFAAPLPLLETVVLTPVILTHDPALAASVLSGGQRIAWAPDGRYAPWGAQADVVLRGGSGGVALGPATGPAESQPTVDRSRPVALLPGGGSDWAVAPETLDRLWCRAVLGSAAELVGLTRRMIDLTVDYVSTREQFGQPIGAFQAVKHHLADAQVAHAFARPLVHSAAWHLTTGSTGTARPHVAMAHARAARTAVAVARTAIQCHGGMGFTTEYDLHLYAKRAWAVAASFGDTGTELDEVARALPTLMQDD